MAAKTAVPCLAAGDAADLRQPDGDGAAEQRQVLRGPVTGDGG